jgi:hypothetical protein
MASGGDYASVGMVRPSVALSEMPFSGPEKPRVICLIIFRDIV